MSLEEVFKRIETLEEDLEELGVGIHVDIKDKPPDERRRVVLHLTAIIRKDLEEAEA